MNYEELESKWWYRLLKVIYIIAHVLVVLFVIFISWDARPQTYSSYYGMPRTYTSGNWNEVFFVLFIGLIITCVVFQIIKRIFFYVSTGKWKALKIRPNVRYCSNCGKELQKETDFCAKCGRKAQ